jgi:hypothetical protein
MLPLDPKKMVTMLDGLVNEVFIDRMNYKYRVKSIYRKAKLNHYLEDHYFHLMALELKEGFEKKGILVTMCY